MLFVRSLSSSSLKHLSSRKWRASPKTFLNFVPQQNLFLRPPHALVSKQGMRSVFYSSKFQWSPHDKANKGHRDGRRSYPSLMLRHISIKNDDDDNDDDSDHSEYAEILDETPKRIKEKQHYERKAKEASRLEEDLQRDQKFKKVATKDLELVKEIEEAKFFRFNKTGKRGRALIIANSKYDRMSKKLKNIDDIAEEAKLLERLFKCFGYEVTVEENLTGLEMDSAVDNFRDQIAEEDDSTIFYYTGHGVNIELDSKKYENHKLVVGSPEFDKSLDKDDCLVGTNGICVATHTIFRKFLKNEQLKKIPKIFIIDACRSSGKFLDEINSPETDENNEDSEEKEKLRRKIKAITKSQSSEKDQQELENCVIARTAPAGHFVSYDGVSDFVKEFITLVIKIASTETPLSEHQKFDYLLFELTRKHASAEFYVILDKKSIKVTLRKEKNAKAFLELLKYYLESQLEDPEKDTRELEEKLDVVRENLRILSTSDQDETVEQKCTNGEEKSIIKDDRNGTPPHFGDL